MHVGEFLTKAAIWLALIAYTVACASMLTGDLEKRARGWWTAGCAFYLLHVVCAFTYFHAWSHTAAYVDTARQTEQMIGRRWGGGLYVNYLFSLAWLADAVWWWVSPNSHARRLPGGRVLWHWFAFFMVFNGTVVFGRGPVRWFGVAVSALLAVLFWRRRHIWWRHPARCD